MINIIVILIFLLSIYISIKYKFIQFKSIKIAVKQLLNKNQKSSYQTFMVALASHIGTGNIVGISTAIIYGGAGSLFWMWIFAITTSIFSLIENTLAIRYNELIDGELRGGSSYYIKKGLKKNLLAIILAIFLVLANTIFFQPLQVNTIVETINLTFGIDKIIILGVMIIFTIIVIFGGTKKIVKFSEIIVPIMSVGYIICSFYILYANINNLPNTLKLILTEAFSIKPIIGGGIGSAFIIGAKRSLFSHEAGLGTMPTISAMADVDKPVNQGHIQVLGVFFDTLVLCSLTGFMLLVNKYDASQFSGCDLILYVFEKSLGNIGKVIASFFLITFALATVVSEYYLGESNLIFITKRKKNKLAISIYQTMFIIGIIIGAFFSTKEIFEIVDLGMVLMGVINIYAILKLRKDFEEELAK